MCCIQSWGGFFEGGCDLAFMVDVSSSIGGEANFKLIMEFVKTIFHSFTMSSSFRYGLVVFGSSVKVSQCKIYVWRLFKLPGKLFCQALKSYHIIICLPWGV